MELESRTNSPCSAALNRMSSVHDDELANRPRLPGSSCVLFMALTALALAGCNGDGDSSSGMSSSSASDSMSSSSSVSSSSSSSSSVTSTLPPLSATVIDLDAGQQIGATHWPDGDTSDGGQGQPVGDLKCDVTSQAYHVHAHLSIFLDGEALAVPADIGIVSTGPTSHCNYSTHTHNRTGIIHVEAPAPGTFTLGEFFSIWGEPLSLTDVGGNPGLPVVVYVTDNNVVSQYTGDPAAIELLSHREITIQIGTPITEIPNYTWSEP